MGNIIHTVLPELPVIEPLYGIIHIKSVLSLSGGLNVPDNQLFPKGLRHSLGQHGLARSWLSLDQKGLLQGNRHIDAGHQFF